VVSVILVHLFRLGYVPLVDFLAQLLEFVHFFSSSVQFWAWPINPDAVVNDAPHAQLNAGVFGAEVSVEGEDFIPLVYQTDYR
jgi:hypothetical protein